MAALVPIVVVDVRHRIIPDVVVIPATTAVIVLDIVAAAGPWWRAPVGALVVAGALLGPALVRPDGMGMGDVKLCALIGAALGVVAGLTAVLVGLVVAAAWGLGRAAVRRMRPSSVSMPLAPFLAAGVLAVILGPVVFVDSAHGAPHDHAHPPGASVRHAALGTGHGWGHASLAGGCSARRAGHRGRGGARGRAAAPRWRARGRGAGSRCHRRPRPAAVHACHGRRPCAVPPTGAPRPPDGPRGDSLCGLPACPHGHRGACPRVGGVRPAGHRPGGRAHGARGGGDDGTLRGRRPDGAPHVCIRGVARPGACSLGRPRGAPRLRHDAFRAGHRPGAPARGIDRRHDRPGHARALAGAVERRCHRHSRAWSLRCPGGGRPRPDAHPRGGGRPLAGARGHPCAGRGVRRLGRPGERLPPHASPRTHEAGGAAGTRSAGRVRGARGRAVCCP